MIYGETFGLLLGAVALGAVHGVEPGHGWPIAASYALDQSNKWLYGFAASFILGIGHLLSSIAMVGAFFYAKSYFNLTQINEPLTVGGFQLGGPVSLVAGVLLIGLGIREYRHGHAHGSHGDEHAHHEGHSHEPTDEHSHHGNHDHNHDGHDHSHDDAHDHSTHDHGDDHTHTQTHEEPGLLARVVNGIPFVGGHSHAHETSEDVTDRGLFGIAWFAFLLGFAHEEEFEIIALCAGSSYCLELMSAYAITVIVGIVGLTMLLIAGYQHSEETVERFTPYLPAFSAAVLTVMGLGFVFGLF